METKKSVLSWAKELGLDNPNNHQAQLIKLMEEIGELCNAILKSKREAEEDAFGDIQVVLEILAKQRGIDLEKAYKDAYEVIKNRKGQMVNGSFIKKEVRQFRFVGTEESIKEYKDAYNPAPYIGCVVDEEYFFQGNHDGIEWAEKQDWFNKEWKEI
jgi:NTP pyrophosphatase (non-canonical NTP hydrolase)